MTEKEIQLMNASCGTGLRSLSVEEMENIYGASDISPQWTPAISIISNSIIRSSKVCISAIGSAISGIVSNNKNCLG